MVRHDSEDSQNGMIYAFDDSAVFQAQNDFNSPFFHQMKDDIEEDIFGLKDLVLLENLDENEGMLQQQVSSEREEFIDEFIELDEQVTEEFSEGCKQRTRRNDQNLTKKINVRGIQALKELQIPKKVQNYVKKFKTNYECFILTLETIRLYDQIPKFQRIFKRLLKELELEYQEKNSVQECAHLKVQKKKISQCISLFFSRYIEESFFSLFEEKKKALNKLGKLKNKLSLLQSIIFQDYV